MRPGGERTGQRQPPWYGSARKAAAWRARPEGNHPRRSGQRLTLLGPRDDAAPLVRQPAFPIYHVHLQPGITHLVDKFPSPCDWLQIREHGMDPIHSIYLHADHQFPETLTELPVLALEETPIGTAALAARRIGELVYLRQNEIFLPTADWVHGLEDENRETVFDRRGGMIDWVVTIDDTNSSTFKMYAVYDFHHQPPSGMDGDMDRASDYIRARTWQGWIDDGRGGTRPVPTSQSEVLP